MKSLPRPLILTFVCALAGCRVAAEEEAVRLRRLAGEETRKD